jgi:antitoxin component of MazEF toxin-antitoxin module
MPKTNPLSFRWTRRVQEQAGSYFVVLPKVWISANGLDQGDQVILVSNDAGDIVVQAPERLGKETPRRT